MSWSGARQHRPNKQQLSAQRSALEAPQRTRSRAQRGVARAPAAGRRPPAPAANQIPGAVQLKFRMFCM
jgi:hypothetical protein